MVNELMDYDHTMFDVYIYNINVDKFYNPSIH